MKKKLFFKFMVFAVIGSLVTMTSCKDYDDDIDNLQGQITSLKATVDAIDASVKGGSVITGVTSNDNGITITLSNGQSYNITNGAAGATGPAGPAGADGAPGAAGADGAPGSVVTIDDESGNWLIDGEDTGLSASGPAGEAGADGAYYYPNEDGFWHKVTGDVDEVTTQAWLPTGTITAVYKNGVVTLYNVDGFEDGYPLGQVGLTKLTLIPDYVADEGGALPVVNFSPLVAECGEIAPSTQVRYQVSPSNATVDQIDVENLEFMYNNPTILNSSRAAGINPTAKFISLEDGVLTVEVDIDTEKLEGPNSNKIDQIMLMVPLKSGGEVSSDWAKVVSTETYSEDLALVRTPKTVEGTAWSAMELTSTLDATKALEVTSPVVVDIEYSETLDLLEVVNTMFRSTWSDFNIDTYNLEYAFDLKDEEGNTIVYELGANETDQQKFINLVGSEVSTRVYDLDGPNPAAVNRTPIVHVMLKSKDGSIDCNVLEGFIKLNIVEKKVVPVPPVEIPATGDVEAGCDDYTLRIGTQRMNEEFYAKAEVSKTFFHTNYVWASSVTDGVGTITEVDDPNDTESYNLLWTVTADELGANVGESISKSGTYTYGSSVIKVTFTANVTQPKIDLSGLLIDNYWFGNKSYVKHNVAVPALGATDPALATYENNINNAFVTTDEKLLDLGFKNPAYNEYNYEYFFDIAANQPVKSVDGITITVSEDRKQLLATQGEVTEVVATILPQEADTGDILEYHEDSELGKYLLNKGPEHMKARIKLEVTNECEQPVVVNAFDGKDSFLVHFLRPVNVEGVAAENFVDGPDAGDEGTVLDLRDVVKLSDWRNYVGGSNNYDFDPDNENYYQYYEVSDIEVDLANIKPRGLTVDGTDMENLPTTIVIGTTAPTGGLDSDFPFGTLTYTNNGANLGTEFTLLVPVTVTYKWGEVTTIVEVPVKPTSDVRSAF